MYKTLSKKAYGVWAGAAMMALGACGGLPSPPKRPVFEAFSLSSKQAPIPAPALMALPKAGASEPPLSLSASDGTGLRLVELSARAILNEPLAFTEIRLVFENPLDRTLEGTFRMVLPEGASLSRFAMKIEDRWQEGEVVERMRAREAFEDFLHRKQDPALLEQAGGNEFSARVFPIPAQGRKELILSYSQELRGDVPFVLPLRGLPELGVTNIVVSSAGAEASLGELHVHDYKPEADFVVETPGEKLGSIGLRNGELMVARISPIESSSPDLITSAIILVDSSASRALGFGEQLRVLQSIIQEIARRSGPQTPISVLCFDQVVESIFEGEAGAFGEGELRRIYSRGALGASNLGAALAWASKKAEKDHAKRVIVLGDGVVTAGEMEAGEIRAKAGALAQAGIERVDAVVVGGIRHSSLLHHLTSMGLARDGVVVEGALSASELGKKLSEMSFSKLPLKVENARWAWPSTLSGIQAGDKVFVYAEVPESIKTPRISIDGRALAPLNLGRAEKPLLQRAWAKAKIDSLLDRQAKEGNLEVQGQLERQIIELSTAHRVLSPYTSLLVLESEGDFERFSIERRALGDILSMDGGKFQVLKRSLPKAPKVHASKAGTVEDRSAIQLGRDENRPNVRGASSSLGSGQGRLSSVRRTVRPPSVRMGATKVSGRLPPEIIQGIIRRNFGRFRACYEQGLRASPNLSGRVTVRFVIDLSGAVSDVNLVDSASVDTKVAVCVAKAFAGLSFPQPEGGFVTVIYPILFVPPNASDPPAEQGAARFGALNKPRFQLPEQRAEQREVPPEPTPYTGRFKVVMDALAKGQAQAGLDEARAWLLASPGDIPALLALGEAFEAKGDTLEAARAYGSIIDLYASRADLRRYAGARLERLKQGAGLDLAVDSYEKAAKDRPDHPSSHRLLGFALLKKGEYQKAFEAVLRGFSRDYPSDRFAGVKGILSEDLGLIAAAWIKAEPSRREEIIDRVYGAGSALEERPSLRFVLNWETDANDVDFHIYDEEGGHAFYGQRTLGTGGMLYADVRTGYGPECFSVRLPKEERSKAYTLMAHYFSRGPMGYGMGKLQVIDHDGKGGLSFEERPFIAMEDKAYVSLGKVLR